MTAMMRQIRKQTLTIAVLAAAVLAGMGAAQAAGAPAPGIVTDPLTGVALDGIDPVSYFTEPQPLPGKPDYEYDWQGVPWYFANAANRDVFMRSPATYAPQFGGHAAMSLARGFLSDGNPQIYLVVQQRLYLFYSIGNREAFQLSPAAAITGARAQWAAFSRPPVVAGAASPQP
jgi:YHS domain-containing protein